MHERMKVVEEPEILRHNPPRRLKTIGLAALGVAIAVVAVGVISRVRADQSLKTWTDDQAVPVVKLIDVSAAAGGSLVLPGNIQAFYDAPIHARVSGYLKRWYADIGTRVKAGQLLAEIDTPDLDQQLAQGKADLATAVANQNLSAITAKRWAGLLAQDAVSKQDADNKNGDLEAKTALVAAAQANLQRLEALESFKRITAPFDGVVTTRSTDVGALIAVGGVTDTPLFSVSDEKRLRIYVQVPQSYIGEIRPGMTATFSVPEYPGRSFTAQLAASADAVTPTTGTQTIQLQIDNSDGALKPGDYAQVHFSLPNDSGAIRAPASALMFRDSGMAVAVLGPNGRVVIKPITIGRDLGTAVEVASGLSPSDRIIDNPPDSLRPGDVVRIASASKSPGANNRAVS
ncbi:MAG TPA: efflux RND transporter periplasmic adaptor subunit [Caulobacteraceae bacterium]|jgi:RND family efflux transporter MFP subunit|nr:efflux RND transporter periplasmic adaptor subunit [Caulobacteraceae bacterium]